MHNNATRHQVERYAWNGAALRVHPAVGIRSTYGELRVRLQFEQNAGSHFDDDATIIACGDNRTLGQSFPDF